MKKYLFEIALLSACTGLISCNNITKNNSSDEDSLAVEEGAVEIVEVVEEVPYTDVEEGKKEITLDFSSYHLYTCEEDKFDASGYQPVSARVIIDEEHKKASLKLYDSGESRWYTFNFRINERLHMQDGVITYIVYNNANQKAYIYVSTDRPGGLFIDINNFVYDNDAICCWMQESGSSGSQYRQEAVTIGRKPNTFQSNPSYSANLSGGSIHSDERITDRYSNYEETSYCVEGVVVYEREDDYYIVETRRGYTVLERRSGILWEGHKIRGELNRYGTKYIINRNRDSEVRVYIENYALSEDDALEWMRENDHLKYDDQEI